jgi:D-alanyl-D-alanine carboxypeptidase/D-alanyl-D-alanine-endopeptidase (penicillin-binding protein 4)
MPKGTTRPRVAIDGSVQAVKFGTALLPKQILLVRHRSLPLSDILKLMNLYSNNVIAESLAVSLGGAQVVAQQAAQIAGFPVQEISLINGSGLGVENRISPRAVCMMFAAVQRYLQPYNLAIADMFPISGTDLGTIDGRSIPTASVVKTGTLNDVSALAGVLPTRDRGLLWFAIINRGADLDSLRAGQDRLLQALTAQWGVPAPLPIAVTPTSVNRNIAAGQDATRRSEIVKTAVEVNTF